MTKNKEERWGELVMMVEVFLHAIWPVGAHYGATMLPQIQFLAIVLLLSAILFLFTTWRRREFKQLLNKKVLLWLSAYTLFFTTLPYLIIVYATKFSSAINTTLLTQSEAIFAGLLGFFILGEKLSRNKILGISFILLANVAILYDGTPSLDLASVALMLAPLLFVFANMIAKKLQREGLNWSPLLLFRMLVGGVTLAFLSYFVEGYQAIDPNLWPFLLFFSFFVFGVAKILWQIALHRLDLSKVTALGMAYPFMSIVIAYFWLGEVPNSYQWFGVLLTALGVAFLLRTKSKQWVEFD